MKQLNRFTLFFMAGLIFLSFSSTAAANYGNEIDQMKLSYSAIVQEQTQLNNQMFQALDKNDIPVFVQILSRYVHNVKNLKQMQEYIQNTNSKHLQKLASMIKMDLLTYNNTLNMVSNLLNIRTEYILNELNRYSSMPGSPVTEEISLLKLSYVHYLQGQEFLSEYFESMDNRVDNIVIVDNNLNVEVIDDNSMNNGLVVEIVQDNGPVVEVVPFNSIGH